MKNPRKRSVFKGFRLVAGEECKASRRQSRLAPRKHCRPARLVTPHSAGRCRRSRQRGRPPSAARRGARVCSLTRLRFIRPRRRSARSPRVMSHVKVRKLSIFSCSCVWLKTLAITGFSPFFRVVVFSCVLSYKFVYFFVMYVLCLSSIHFP